MKTLEDKLRSKEIIDEIFFAFEGDALEDSDVRAIFSGVSAGNREDKLFYCSEAMFYYKNPRWVFQGFVHPCRFLGKTGLPLSGELN